MNCTYRSIWNDKSGTFVAVAENTRSAGKKTSSSTQAQAGNEAFGLKALALSLILSFGANVYALPAGGVVAAGNANISSGVGSTTITQTTQSAAINWQSFGIGQTEAVHFVQPNSSSVILNRVLGSDPSNILGSMTANGKVFLVNPNGVLFGKGASVNVGGLVASTLNISDSDFMAGRYKFVGTGGTGGSVLNLGSIHADGGSVALLGANVSNDGNIVARLGTVALAAGNAITLDLAGDGLLHVTVDQGAVNALVQNGGLIQADGGQVLLTARSASSLLQSAVNNTGVIQAQTIENHNGTIQLMGDMQSGTVNVGGKLDASAPHGGDGGFVETSAAHVKIADNALVTTYSAQGKTGNWLIDPLNFTIGTDIAGSTLSALLVTNSVNIDTVAGPIPPVPGSTPPLSTFGSGLAGASLGDITVSEAVTWTATPSPTTLTLNAAHDVNVNAALNATTGSFVFKAGNDINMNAAITTTTGDIHSNAGRDLNVNAAVSQTTGNFIACCGRDININAVMTMTTGDILLRAGPDGSGKGVPGVGGTVTFAPGIMYTVTDAAPHTIVIDYTPSSYTAPINDYSSHFTGTGATLLQVHMLAFLQGDKVYDGSASTNLTLKNTLGAGVALTAAPGATATFASTDAGTSAITYSGYTLTGVNAAQYAIWDSCVAPGTMNAIIAPRPVTVKADDATKVYGQTFTPTNTAFTTPVPPAPGETITSVDEATPGTPATVPVATYLITPSNATGATFNPANYIITYQTGNLVVTPAPLTVTANSFSKTYGQTSTLAPTAFTTSGLVNSETVASVTEVSAGLPASAHVAGSPYDIVPSAATGGTFTPSNYTIAYVNGALTVNPAPLTVTADNVTKVYGQAPALSGFSTTALVNGETVGSVTEVSTGQPATASVAGSPYAIVPSAATGGTFTPSDYTIGYVNGVLTVTPAPLTVTANNATKPFGTVITLPVTAFTTTGLKNGETVASVTETSPGTVITAPVAGSPYPIKPSNATGGTFTPGNYTTSYVNGVLTVTPVAALPPVIAPPVVPTSPTTGPLLPVAVIGTPLQLLTVVSSAPPELVVIPAPIPVVSQPEAPVVVPVEAPPPVFVAPPHPRKQDRN